MQPRGPPTPGLPYSYARVATADPVRRASMAPTIVWNGPARTAEKKHKGAVAKKSHHDAAASFEARLRGLTDAVNALTNSTRRIADAEHQRARAALDAARNTPLRSDPEAVERAVAELTPAARQKATQLAPGLASKPPDDPDWQSYDEIGTGNTAYIRVGSLEDTPVIAPLLGTNGWHVRSDQPPKAHRLLQTIALRLTATARPFRLRIDAFDPRLTGAMGLLGHLTTKYPQLVPRATHTAEQLHATLAALVDVSSLRASRMEQLGHRRFEDLVKETGRATDPYRLVVIFDYPAGVDAQAQRDLIRLAATARDRGICFLVHYDTSVKPDHDVDPEQLTRLLNAVTITDRRVELAALPGVPARLDPAFDAGVAAQVCDVVADLADRAVLPTIDFADTLPPRSEWWRPVGDELSAVVGFDDRTPALVRLRSGNPALPHVLVGGAVGQGKSNFLLVLIHALAVKYSPDDLEMYLLDFKHGVEFSALGPSESREHWLPHARVLGVHSDRPFGLAVLRHLSEELRRRSDIFKSHGNVADINELADGLPRILVVLDEFQVLLEDDDELADEALRLLERLVRLGRAYGVHVVLATQTIEGVKRLATKRDSIFGQVPYRIALKTTPTDSQAILRAGNTAAAELQFRGEAILNANFGSPDDNQHILVSFADKELLDRLRHELWDKSGTPRLPRLFHLAEPARLTDTLSAVRPEPYRAWAGLPISVDEGPATVDVRPEPGAGVLVLGDGPADALGVLTGLALSVAEVSSVSPAYIVLDATPGEQVAGKVALMDALRQLGCQVEHVVDVVPRLFTLRDQMREGVGNPTYVIGIGMHALPQMKTHAEGRFESPADALQDIVREGPSARVVLFGWWNRLHVCTDHLGYGRCNVAAHLFLRHPRDGVRAVCGPLVRWASEPFRGLLWDGISTEPIVVVPFAPLGPVR